MIDEHERSTEAPDLIERWRADLASFESPAYMRGRADGRAWASGRATLHQIHRIDWFRKARNANGIWPDSFPNVSACNPVPPSMALMNVIGMRGRNEFMDYHGRHDYFAKTIGVPGAEHEGSGYCIGFCDGAVAVYDEVKNQL